MTSERKPIAVPSILPVLVLALLAGGLTLVFLESLRADTPVVVAARPIAIGARLAEGDLALRQVRRADALPGALSRVEDAAGQVIGVQRLAGDPITAEMLGGRAASAIAAGLAPDHRAIAVRVTRSSGLAGIVRPGDFVSLIAVVEPDAAAGLFAPEAIPLEATPFPSATPSGALVPASPFARITATGLRVLLVPQTFRYEEATTTDSQGFALAQSSIAGQSESVVVLDVPVRPITVDGADGTVTMSLPELIALLDTHAQVFLALEPASGADEAHTPGVALEQIVAIGVGR